MSTTLDAFLVKTPGICGGRIRIDGTRITVHRIATLYKRGQQPEEILQTYPHLALSQVYTALAYFHANRDEIDREIRSVVHPGARDLDPIGRIERRVVWRWPAAIPARSG